jgi:hypothetical protein
MELRHVRLYGHDVGYRIGQSDLASYRRLLQEQASAEPTPR